MLASDFRPAAVKLGPVGKVVAYVLLFTVLYPISRILMLFRFWPPLPSSDRLKNAFGVYCPGPGDVVVCSYFKSGTTWMLQIVTQIAWRGEAEFDNIHYVVPWPDAPPPHRKQIIPIENTSPAERSPTGLRAIKTHLNAAQIPWAEHAKYIAVVRDPKAVVVSGYHFIKAIGLGPTMPPFGIWVDMFTMRRFFQGSWARHLAGYWARRGQQNLLFVRYEELRADLPGGIDRIAAFMGVELTTAQRARVISRTSFAGMRREGHKFDPGGGAPWRKTGGAVMLRDGGTGKKDTLLSPVLAGRIDEFSLFELKAFHCDFDYEGAYAKDRLLADFPLE
jgi:hypothetical protein